MVKLYIKEKGLDTVANVIASMAARGNNTKPLMGRISNIMLLSVARNFEAEGRPTKWKPLSPLTQEIYSGRLLDRLKATAGYQKIKKDATRERRESAYIQKHGSKLLQQSGDLRKSIVIGKITRESAEVGSPLVYARIHALGGVIRPKTKRSLLIPLGSGKYLRVTKVTIPARNYLELQDEDGVTIMMATKDYLLEAAYERS
ncbi:hypothetical protein DCCM_3252 [Desulfocucumis palustris]|uniref:Uncharacterized protein n=1 Tax=Desulfocucumis palustris TaxID=1898651 RepID=A0A2L2XDA3_9FIRM|nr:phage virion morphogenesis protein [Desulfocucumis palustris]GBF34140.1 hypothetical protein DCCM_3252 [Desulfocucumis palustris]